MVYTRYTLGICTDMVYTWYQVFTMKTNWEGGGGALAPNQFEHTAYTASRQCSRRRRLGEKLRESREAVSVFKGTSRVT